MTLFFIGIAVWTVLAVIVGLILGRIIRTGTEDAEEIIGDASTLGREIGK